MLGLILYIGFVSIPTPLAAPLVTEVKVSLGSSDNELKFFPNKLQLVGAQGKSALRCGTAFDLLSGVLD
jgi:hypothetical protein